MIELLDLDTEKLPRPRGLSLREDCDTCLRLVVDLATIGDARAWAAALGITLDDTDPGCRYIMVKQEWGVAERGRLRVQVIGTEAASPDEQDARRVVQAAARIVAGAVSG